MRTAAQWLGSTAEAQQKGTNYTAGGQKGKKQVPGRTHKFGSAFTNWFLDAACKGIRQMPGYAGRNRRHLLEEGVAQGVEVPGVGGMGGVMLAAQLGQVEHHDGQAEPRSLREAALHGCHHSCH